MTVEEIYILYLSRSSRHQEPMSKPAELLLIHLVHLACIPGHPQGGAAENLKLDEFVSGWIGLDENVDYVACLEEISGD